MHECKGVCGRNKAVISSLVSKYANGIFRCRNCSIYLTINGVKFGKRKTCLCCGYIIATKPKEAKQKKNFYETMASRFA